MEMNLTYANVWLEPQRGLSLTDAAGVEVTCLSGRAWLTMEGDSRDIALSSGDACTIERNGLTLVSAAEPSLVHVRIPRARAERGGWQRWISRIGAVLVQAGEERARRVGLSRYY